MVLLTNVKSNFRLKFHKWKPQLLVLDKTLSLLIVILLGIYRPDYVIIAAYLLAIPYILITRRKLLLSHFIVSSLIALVWMLIAKGQYAYNRPFLVFSGINLYPLFGWAVGLFLIYLVYSHYEHIFFERGFLRQLLLFIAFYWPLLLAVESIAYHLFDIRNVAAAQYPGLPFCNCIHAPLWMQLSYFALGPLFFSACYLLGLENPHFAVKKDGRGSNKRK
ncbi:hypothetical protein HYU13_05470 [Candidatus Woesearchaeota archaeon]|nr:hypothetical protein [Candidatus Woesearchaeota archaeon]